MTITKDKVVQFHYVLKDADGNLLEDSRKRDEVVAYLHGHDSMLPGIEAALEGRDTGETCSVTLVEPYGPYRADSVQRVPLKHLATKKRPVPGMATVVNTAQGPREVVVLKVGRFNVDVDTNHPYAGKTLSYDIEVTGVRDATEEELAHGHAHGAGGHHH
ncbi:peptidylprolyl isomerase [Granulosicoccaceae sp. 1_MG-2023]|nr:peptidylprolyl isomerase [Granulosicoccaceae sp. 1_MG-2023]